MFFIVFVSYSCCQVFIVFISNNDSEDKNISIDSSKIMISILL